MKDADFLETWLKWHLYCLPLGHDGLATHCKETIWRLSWHNIKSMNTIGKEEQLGGSWLSAIKIQHNAFTIKTAPVGTVGR